MRIGAIGYGWRAIRRQPASSILCAVALAIGIGSTTAMFGIVDALLVRPLPFPDASRLVRVDSVNAAGQRVPMAAAEFLALSSRSSTLEAASAIDSYADILVSEVGAEQVRVSASSASVFAMLDLRPLIGRLLEPSEDRSGPPSVAIASHAFWKRHFGGQHDAVGRVIHLENHAYTIIGVLPPGAAVPYAEKADLFVALEITPAQAAEASKRRGLNCFGRLRRGVSATAAHAELASILGHVSGFGAYVQPLQQALVAEHAPALEAAFAGLLVLLGISSTNVALLLLARATARTREIALHAALGATPAHLALQQVVEGILLALAGSLLGLLLAIVFLHVLLQASPLNLPGLGNVRFSWRVFAFEFGIALASGGLATIAAARSARRIDLFRALNTGDATSSTHDKRAQSALVVTQIALAVSLTIAAGLLLRSFQRFTAVSLGFDTERVTTALVAPRSAAAPRAAERFLSDVRTILAMESAALVSCLPLDLSCGWGGVVAIEGRQSSSTNPDYTALNWVTPGYLRTVRIPVLKGRDFDERDRAGSAPVALVNETFVRRYLAGRDPIGVLVTPDDVPAVTRTVVGVVGDVHQWGPAWAPIPEIYLAHAQSRPPVTQLVFRSTVDLAGIERRVSAAVLEFSGDIVVGQAKPLAAFLESRVQQRRYSTIWSIAFAATSILMAGLGVYGVMSLSVVRRRRELAIRAALGAQRSQLIGLVLASGARVIGVGVLFGAAGAFVATRWLRSVLFDVDPGDPAVYVFSTLVLMLVAVAAMFVPAARASFTDPVSTLRAE